MEDKTTTIYLVRHGAIDLKDGEAIEENPPLNKKGIEQAKKLGKQFKEVDPELNKVVTSTMKRSVQTAEIICDYLGLKYSSFPEFNEFSRKVFKKKILTNKFWVSYSKLKKARQKFEEILSENEGKKILFVIHGNVIKGLLMSFLGLSLKQVDHFSYGHTNVSRLTFKKGKLNTISYFGSKTVF